MDGYVFHLKEYIEVRIVVWTVNEKVATVKIIKISCLD